MEYIPGMKLWISTTPTPKTTNVNDYVLHLQHLFTGTFINQQLGILNRKRTRYKRWDCYIRKQKAVHQMCEEILKCVYTNINTKGKLKDNEIVVAFGNASWNKVKGYASSPRGKTFYNYFQRAFQGIQVENTNEFNTN